MPRRLLLLASALLLVTWVAVAYREAQRIGVTRQEISLPRLPSEFEGFRVLLLSDLHLTADSAFTAQLRDRIQSVDADVLLIAGDFKDLFVDEQTATQQMLQLLPAFGRTSQVFAVNGNQDPPRLVRDLESLGIRVLRNEREILKRGDATLGIVGISYPVEGPGLDRGLKHFRDDRGRALPDCQILLAHSPDVMLWGAVRQADLVLAGHTHGGQVCLPWVGALTTRTRLGRRYAAGLFSFGQTQLFITRGVGTTFVPLRFLSPPEIVLITLRTKPAGH
ncbi:MAG: metallophosphoesterase [Acidobacteria bacterium]|nr:metallophosphoesterase [Acidobacteriota bacterium]